MNRSMVVLATLGLMGCASGGGYPAGRGPDVVIVGDDDYGRDNRGNGRGNNGRGNKNGHYKNGKAGYRTLSVASAYYPQAGLCRLWFTGRLGRVQPRARSCDRLYGRVPAGSFILYGGNAWDGDYDWYSYDRQYRGRVPRTIVQISMSMRRR